MQTTHTTAQPKYLPHATLQQLFAVMQGEQHELPSYLKEADIAGIYAAMGNVPFKVRFHSNRWEMIKQMPGEIIPAIILYGDKPEDVADIALFTGIHHAYQTYFGFQ